jgi:peptidoglycan/xylan/chitin deacetylase (PgdA/CDA1 family)
MPLWRQLLLTLYYHATRPVRACRYWREVSREQFPLMVLFYHRIADDQADDCTVSNAMFLRQISWLRDRFDFISLDDAQQRIRRGYNPQPCVSITFDDGYADNCQQAVPWLIKNRIPFTYFVTLQNVQNGTPFPHDVARGYRFAPNTFEQLRAMAAAGVEIGSHACTHADLGKIADPHVLHYELVASKEGLQAAIGRPIRYFAFPFGQRSNMSSLAIAVAKKAGYAGVCSAYGGFNFPGDDPFHLQRIPVDDNMIRLKNWVTMDPRKLHTKRFEYQIAGDVGLGILNAENATTMIPSASSISNL